MRLLLVVNNISDVSFLEELAAQQKFAPNPNCNYLYEGQILHHEVNILTTGYGAFQTGYKLSKVLSTNKYHLALKLSIANAYKPEHNPGTALNIINEKPGDFGVFEMGEWRDLYDQQLLKSEDMPHVRGGFINMTNAYMNIFMPFKKAVGITVNTLCQNGLVEMRSAKYKADVETADGLTFAYTCLFEKQTYYHLAFVVKNLTTEEQDIELVKQKMNEVFIDLINKL